MANMPKTRDELLVASLRHVVELSNLLHHAEVEATRLLDAGDPAKARLFKILREDFDQMYGVVLLQAADNLGIDLRP